jgi:hypothetical protein
MYSLVLIIFVVSEKKAGKMFQNASSLKPLGQLKPNCPRMIIGRPSIKFVVLMTIGKIMYSLVLIIFVVSEKKAFEHFP